MTTRRIFAMGGGGFCMEPDNPRLDRFVLSLAQSKRPRVCLVPTAGGDSASTIDKFGAAFTQERCEPSVLSLFGGSHANIREHLLSQDVIYVSGGNTRNMLALWARWGVDAAMREAWEAGVVLAGLSAGSICWFESGVTDSFPGELRALPCLGFLSGSHCPHYDGEPMRRPTYQALVASGEIDPGIAADDGVGLLYEDSTMSDIVSSRENAAAYRVERDGEGVRETVLGARLLAL